MANALQMQGKIRITALQLAFLNITTIISTSDVFLPAFVAQEAKQDSWISVLIGTVTSLIVTNIILALGLKHSKKTIIQYSCDILGKPLGKLVGLSYVLFYLYLCYSVTGELGEIFVISFNPGSPIAVYSIFTIIVAAYAVTKGLEVIARINYLLLPFGIAILGLVAMLNIPKMHMENFLPILYEGIYPSIKGSFLIQSWLFEVLLIFQLIPFVKDKDKIKKYINVSVIFLGISLMFGVLTIAVLGSLTERYMFPALQYVRYASVGHYIQNLDISIMVLWVSGIFIKIAITYYCTLLSITQFFGLESYKNLILPVGLLIIASSLNSTKTITDMVHSLHYIFPFHMFLMGFIIPFILLLVSVIKDKIKAAVSANQQS